MMKWIFGGLVVGLMLVNCAGTFLLVRNATSRPGNTAPASIKLPEHDGVVGVGARMNGAFLELGGDFNSGMLSINHPEVYSLTRQPAFRIYVNDKGVPQFAFWNGTKIHTLDFTGVGRLRPNTGDSPIGAFGLEPPKE